MKRLYERENRPKSMNIFQNQQRHSPDMGKPNDGVK